MNAIKKLDMFRGFAALIVLLFHFYTFYPEVFSGSVFSIFKIGHIGVDLFFVLSGFLITLSLWNSRNFSHFFTKRIKRIVPLAWATILLFFVAKQNFSHESFLDVFAHLFFINGFFLEWYSSINPVAWSISIEMAFYLLLPFVWIVLAQKKMKRFLSIFSFLVCVSFIYRGFLFYYFQHNLDISFHEKIVYSEQLWGRLDQFFMGILLAVLYVKNKISLQYSKIFFLISTLLLIYSAYVFFIYESAFRNVLLFQVFLHSLIGFGFMGMLYFFVSLPNTHLLKNNCITDSLAWLGKISYGIYLLHFVIISAVHAFFQNSEMFSVFLQFILVLLVTLFFSWASYTFFEKRFL